MISYELKIESYYLKHICMYEYIYFNNKKAKKDPSDFQIGTNSKTNEQLYRN
jgi:hypothetical protein